MSGWVGLCVVEIGHGDFHALNEAGRHNDMSEWIWVGALGNLVKSWAASGKALEMQETRSPTFGLGGNLAYRSV